MGLTASKPFGSFTKEEIAMAVAELGDRYQAYYSAIVGNGVDGSFLEELSDDEIQETFDDLGITNRLHRRVLNKELRDAKSNTEFVSFAYEYTLSTSFSDLEAYDQIVAKCFAKCFASDTDGAVYSGIHLVLDNGNHLALASRTLRDGEIIARRQHQPKLLSICGNLLHDGSDAEFYIVRCPTRFEDIAFNGLRPLTYSGYTLHDEHGDRVGFVCRIDRCYPGDIDEPRRKDFLRQLAKEAEFQLRLRKTSVERRKTFDVKIDQQDIIFPELLAAPKPFAPPQKVKSPAAVKRRRSIGDILPLSVVYHAKQEVRSSRLLPVFQSNLASAKECPHLATNFYNAVDLFLAPRPPISKDDMERVALVEELRLVDISPSDEIAIYFKQIVKNAAQALGFPVGKITLLGHENEFSLAYYDPNQFLSNDRNQLGEVLKENSDGTPFLCKRPRALSISNYTTIAGGTFVVLDMAADESFQWLVAATPLRSYAGRPIVDASRRVIATLCFLDTKPRPPLDVFLESQLEYFTSLALQSIMKWTVVRTSRRLEEERILLALGRDKSAPPEGSVTIVLTDIQDSVALWESIPAEMQDSQDLHDSLIRKSCADHCGYEVETEGDAFMLAFHDPADAIGFALDAQKALFEADWPPGLLSRPEAREIPGSFRGLRVRMAIHRGKVDSFENEVTRRVNYKGETMGLVKRLASLACGGQILTTRETWEVASFSTGSSLGYPQVIDLGMHVVRKGKSFQNGVVAKRIIQLVPSNLAYDYFAARKLLSDTKF